VIIFSASYIAMMISFKTNKKKYPFSEKFTQDSQREGSILNFFITASVVGACFIIHRLLQNNLLYLMIFAAIIMIFDLIMWQLAFKGNWETYEQ
jgi:hypothetical protein